MVNVREPPTTRSDGKNSDIVTMKSDPEHILCNSTNPPVCTVYASPRLTRQTVQTDVKTLAHALDFKDDCPPSDPF